MARQMWIDALWSLGQRSRAREQAADVSQQAARRRMRQTVSIVELQAACWAAEERDYQLMARHWRLACDWGAPTGAMPERAIVAALDLVLALSEADHDRAERAASRVSEEGRGYEEEMFVALVAHACQLADNNGEVNVREKLTLVQ